MSGLKVGKSAAFNGLATKRLRIYHPTWFQITLRRSTMKPINLFAYYQLGASLRRAAEVKLSNLTTEVAVSIWQGFAQIDKLIDSDPPGGRMYLESANGLRSALHDLIREMGNEKKLKKLDDNSIASVWSCLQNFEAVFEQACAGMRIFSVTPKGIYDTVQLVDSAENALGEKTVRRLPAEVKADFNLAGRCLAFELWTATGFHTIRAVEAVARSYYKTVMRVTELPDNFMLGTLARELTNQLEKEEGTKVSDSPLGLIASALSRINKVYRCPIMHPEMVLNADQARQVFDLASSVIPLILADQEVRSAKTT